MPCIRAARAIGCRQRSTNPIAVDARTAGTGGSRPAFSDFPPARRSTDMLGRPTSPRWALVAAVVALGGVAGAARLATGSDHQDTPFVELNPKTDMTDVYAFPGSASGRIVLVMDTRAFLTPAQATDPAQASFDPNLLYQFKVDNNGDAKEDKVIQVTFTGEGAKQQVQVRGPTRASSGRRHGERGRRRHPGGDRSAQHQSRQRERHSGVRRALATTRSSSTSRPPSASCPIAGRLAGPLSSSCALNRMARRRSSSGIPGSTTSPAST